LHLNNRNYWNYNYIYNKGVILISEIINVIILIMPSMAHWKGIHHLYFDGQIPEVHENVHPMERINEEIRNV